MVYCKYTLFTKLPWPEDSEGTVATLAGLPNAAYLRQKERVPIAANRIGCTTMSNWLDCFVTLCC